jgi:hypothetical protein
MNAYGPRLLTPTRLAAQSEALQTSIYWDGPREGYRYELWRLPNANVFVRYLPEGVTAGANSTNYLIVATYQVPDAFAVLKERANGNAIAGPGGSIVLVDRRRGFKSTSVYVAFPNVDYEIEIYDPSPAVALATAESGDIQPVVGR